MPNVLKEAMLKECIILSTYTPGLDELIENTKNGFILDELDVKDIIQLISHLSEEKKNKIKINAKKYIIERFNVTNCMKQYIDIWKA